MNQHGLSLVDLRCVDKRLPGRRRRQWNRSGLFEINILRFERHLALFRNRKLRVTAAAHDRQVRINRIAGFELRYPGSCFFHHACDIITDDRRPFVEPSLGQHPLPRVRIHRIDCGCDDTHQNLVIFRLRSRHLFQFQCFWTAVLAQHHRFHQRPRCGMRRKTGDSRKRNHL